MNKTARQDQDSEKLINLENSVNGLGFKSKQDFIVKDQTHWPTTLEGYQCRLKIQSLQLCTDEVLYNYISLFLIKIIMKLLFRGLKK